MCPGKSELGLTYPINMAFYWSLGKSPALFIFSERVDLIFIQTQHNRNLAMELFPKRRKINSKWSQTPAWLDCIQDAEGRDKTNPHYDPSTLLIPQAVWKTFTRTEDQVWAFKQDRFDQVILVETNDKNFQILFPHGELCRRLPIPFQTHQANCHDTIKSLLRYGYPVALLERDPIFEAQRPIPLKKGHTYTPGTSGDQDIPQREISLLSIRQYDNNRTMFSIACFDAVTKHLYLSEINGQKALLTLLARTQPRELLLHTGSLSAAALELLRSNVPQWTCWTHARKTYRIEDAPDLEEKITRRLDGAWPEALLQAKVNPMLLSPIVQLIDYEHRIGEEFLDLRKAGWPSESRGAFTVLHANTSENLELHRNSFDGTTNGTLSDLLNHCVTPFGKLLLKQWMDSPLYDISRIEQRADWADTIVQNRLVEQMDLNLKEVPNLAKLLQCIEGGRCEARDLAVTLTGYRTILKVLTSIQRHCSDHIFEAQYQFSLASFESLLDQWENIFDWSKTEHENSLHLNKGQDADFDTHQDTIYRTTKEYSELLSTFETEIARKIKVAKSKTNTYEFHIPIRKRRLAPNVPPGWQLLRKRFELYMYQAPQNFHDIAARLDKQTSDFRELAISVCSRLRVDFIDQILVWKTALEIATHMDCFLAIAKLSKNLDLPKCRPKFYSEGSPRIECKSLRHPCLRTENGVISNDVHLGGQNHNIWFLTAPNGGGKSTLMRTICVAVIMAQMGCNVPAQSMALTPMNHIFTRMGAGDDVCSGESTFHRELKETLEIVHDASESALVMIDELGRGTSSVDGDALALAVLQYLAHRPACIGVFSTHSISLASEVRTMGTGSLKCMRSRAGDNDMCPLFVVGDGVIDDGYGQSCAKAYGIPNKILERASAILEQQREEDTPEKVPTGVWHDVLNAEQSQDLSRVEIYAEYIHWLVTNDLT